jgi:prepilin-type N-terminal cleavage/methylation domain-containing protein
MLPFKNQRQKSAFTLIELLVVIAIIGLLATLSVIALNNARAKSRDAKRLADAKQFETAMELYFNAAGHYPSVAEFQTGRIEYDSGSGTTTYMQVIPSAPTPADGTCDDAANTYTYNQVDGGASYTMNFCVANASSDLGGGNLTVWPGGISGSNGGNGGGGGQQTGGSSFETFVTAAGSELRSSVQARDGGYIAVGNDSLGGYMVKFDSAGNVSSEKRTDADGIDMTFDIIRGNDNGYIVAARDMASSKAVMVKIDEALNIVWTYSPAYPENSNSPRAKALIPVSGGYVFGYTGSHVYVQAPCSDCNYQVASLSKVDNSGNEIWNTSYGERYVGNRLDSVISTSDGGFLITGLSDRDGYPWNSWILKVDASGAQQYEHVGSYNAIAAAVEKPGGGYLAVGSRNGYFLDLDSQLNVLASSDFEPVDGEGSSLYSITRVGTDYVISGVFYYSDDLSDYFGDIDIIKIDASGNQIWRRTIAEGPYAEDFPSVALMSDGGFLVTGTQYTDQSWNDWRGFLIKTDSSGLIQ